MDVYSIQVYHTRYVYYFAPSSPTPPFSLSLFSLLPSIHSLLLFIHTYQAVNPIELGTVAMAEILRRFYQDFPPHPEEKKYNYVVSSSMKPTQVCVCMYVHVWVDR